MSYPQSSMRHCAHIVGSSTSTQVPLRCSMCGHIVENMSTVVGHCNAKSIRRRRCHQNANGRGCRVMKGPVGEKLLMSSGIATDSRNSSWPLQTANESTRPNSCVIGPFAIQSSIFRAFYTSQYLIISLEHPYAVACVAMPRLRLAPIRRWHENHSLNRGYS